MKKEIILIFICTIIPVYCVKSQEYILIFKSSIDNDVLFYHTIVHFSISTDQSKMKIVEFPRYDSGIDAMLCCELDTVTWFTLIELVKLDSLKGADYISKTLKKYKLMNKRTLKKREKLKFNPKEAIKWDDDFIYAYTCDIRWCDCLLWMHGNVMGKRGYEVGYITSIKNLKKVNKEQRDMIESHIEDIYKYLFSIKWFY